MPCKGCSEELENCTCLQAAGDKCSAELALLSGQLEAACKLIGHIADCPYCHFGVEKEECSDECNKFERGEGWECWKEYLGKQPFNDLIRRKRI